MRGSAVHEARARGVGHEHRIRCRVRRLRHESDEGRTQRGQLRAAHAHGRRAADGLDHRVDVNAALAGRQLSERSLPRDRVLGRVVERQLGAVDLHGEHLGKALEEPRRGRRGLQLDGKEHAQHTGARARLDVLAQPAVAFLRGAVRAAGHHEHRDHDAEHEQSAHGQDLELERHRGARLHGRKDFRLVGSRCSCARVGRMQVSVRRRTRGVAGGATAACAPSGRASKPQPEVAAAPS